MEAQLVTRRARIISLLMVLTAVAAAVMCGATAQAAQKTTLTAFVGSASKPPAQEAKAAYEKAHPNVTIEMTFAGSGTLLNQIVLEKTGDIYMPGSDDFMDKAEKRKAVEPSTRRIVAYLVPMINVRRGNPKHIHSLKDLARPGVSVGLARPVSVCLGDVSAEILRKAGLEARVKKNVVTYAGSCELTEKLIELGEVDAIIGWDSFRAWAPSKLENVRIAAKYVRVRNIPAAVCAYSNQPRAAAGFVNFLASPQGKAIFSKHGYSVKQPKA